MTVDTFDPSAMAQPIDAKLAAALCAAAEISADNELVLAELDVKRFAPMASGGDWSTLGDELSDEQVAQLIRIFTLGEMQFSSWTAADKSPVIALVQLLKQRGVYEPEMTRWIKSNTTNRFLPHGNLLNRL
ncbi:MAG: hypothetical protein NXH95_09795 [Pseudomonadaceae bacterium]|nr:hypothetical protein [Pseudomonadaceae bacterium]